MDSKASSINRAMAEELDAERSGLRDENGKRISVERFANESGIGYSTMRRILNARVDINLGDLLSMVSLINQYRRSPITSAEIMDRAVARAGGMEKIAEEFGITPLSEGASTNDELAERRRKQEEAARMSVEELENARGAATRDAELDSDEPELP